MKKLLDLYENTSNIEKYKTRRPFQKVKSQNKFQLSKKYCNRNAQA